LLFASPDKRHTFYHFSLPTVKKNDFVGAGYARDITATIARELACIARAPTKRLLILQTTLPGFCYLSMLFNYLNHFHYFNSLIKESL